MNRLRTLVGGIAVVALTSGCGFHGVYSLPLPGAAATGGHTYLVKVQLADVLDLVPYSAVKVNALFDHSNWFVRVSVNATFIVSWNR